MGGANGFVSRALRKQGGTGVLAWLEVPLSGSAKASRNDGRFGKDNAADLIGPGRDLPVDSGSTLEANAIRDSCRDGDLIFPCDCGYHGKMILLELELIKENFTAMESLGYLSVANTTVFPPPD
jgi:hypothetical protein